jgi:protein SCO1
MTDQPVRPVSHRLEWLVFSALIITVLIIGAAFLRDRLRDRGLEGKVQLAIPVPDFTLTNQFGQTVSLSNLLGQVWVADVIFTTCPMSCEQMTRRMKAVTAQISDRAPVKFVSITAYPQHDTPEVLKKYAVDRGLDQARWHFLTGVKSNVYELSIHGMKFAVLDNTNRVIPEDLFIHSTHFALVDKRGHIRGYFEGTEEEDRRQLVLSVKKLLRER